MTMAEIVGTSNRVLDVNLTTRTFEICDISNTDRLLYLGGKGLGLKLLYDRMKQGADPLGVENAIAFMMGVLMGTGAPCSGRFDAITKSPLTGIMTTSSCGGPFGMQLKTAGWDGLIVTGKASHPTYLEIDAHGVSFKDATTLWGLYGTTAQEKIVTHKHAGALVIGPAGENMVRYANIMSGHRFLGRGGMGAVLGSKNLKAIVARGGHFKIVPKDKKAFEKNKKRAQKYIAQNPTTSVHYRNYGTPSIVTMANNAGSLPVNNFRRGSHGDSYQISGQGMEKKHQSKHHTCKPCSILCGKKGRFEGKTLTVPEYETVTVLGSNLGVFDTEKIAQWNQLCSELGLDTISAGGTLAWVMEATEKGLVKTNLKFGSYEGIDDALRDIGLSRNFGAEMAMGSRWLAKKYGGMEFAIQVKGLEMAGYDPRSMFGQGLAYAVANRGACHLSAYMVAFELLFGLLNPKTKLAKPTFTKIMEDVYCVVNAMHICQFTTYAFLLETPMVKLLPRAVVFFCMQFLPKIAAQILDMSLFSGFWSSITGLKMSPTQIKRCGARIHTLERLMNTREGISKKDDVLPMRLLKQARQDDPENLTIPLKQMISSYYKTRGYDKNGIPTQKLLKKLAIIS
jgi:aldehyde:ferredoxin oxidoreductase